jgi:GT2 family glycosyltransferase
MEAVMSTDAPLHRERIAATCVVTVTYGDRFHLLDEIVAAVASMGVGKIIVVDNACAPRSQKSIDGLPERYGSTVEIVRLPENRGSAGGFKAGLQRAAATGCDFLWLLDDDNKPMPDALDRLFSAYDLLGSDPRNALQCARLMDYGDGRGMSRRNPVAIEPSSFLAFDLRKLPERLRQRVARYLAPDALPPLKRVDCALYGGFFLHSSWLDVIGYPMEELFVDMDDIEYSSRLVAQGGAIYQCNASVIVDIDRSWPVGNLFVSAGAQEDRVYYSARNRMYLGRRLITNRVWYFANAVSYSCFLVFRGVLSLRSPGAVARRWRLIGKALADGRRGQLGARRLSP